MEFNHVQNMKLVGNYNHNLREAAVSEATELEMQNIIPGMHIFDRKLFVEGISFAQAFSILF